MTAPRLSLVIPLAPRDPLPSHLLEHWPRSDELECIVSATREPPKNAPADVTWLAGRPGRGVQLNRGASAASGEWLFFLHADSRIGSDAWPKLARFIDRSEPAIGYGRLHFLNDGPAPVALNAWGANLRSRWLGRPYGDQGLCLPRDAFWGLGGFREDLERGEDLDFIVRARTAGLLTRSLGLDVWTSARRYREHGWLRTTLAHHRAARRLIRGAQRAAKDTTS